MAISPGDKLGPYGAVGARHDGAVGARHDQGSSKASISKGKRERGGREAVEMGAKLSYGVTERYGAGY